jgi:hypothetical protein
VNAFTRTATACTITAAALLSASPASAAECTPAPAWAEQVEVTPAVPAHRATVPGADAVGEPTIQVKVANPDYVAPTYTPGFWDHVKAVYTPPVGEKTIPNPDYEPAVPGTDAVKEVSHFVHHDPVTIEHPAEYKHHDAIPASQVQDGVVKWVWTGGATYDAPAFPGDGWNRTNDTHPNKHDPLGEVYRTGHGPYNASWAIYAPVFKTIPGKDAWDEKISDAWTETVSEAWDEKVIDVAYQPAVPGQPAVGEPTIDNPDYIAPTYVPAHDVWVPPVYTPAVGEPTITVIRDNPDYVPAIPTKTVEVEAVPAVTDTVHHDAVTCLAEPTTPTEPENPTRPTTPEKPTTPDMPSVPTEPAAAAHRASVMVVPTAELAHTGSETPWMLGIAGLVLAGVGLCTISIGATRRNRGGDQ